MLSSGHDLGTHELSSYGYQYRTKPVDGSASIQKNLETLAEEPLAVWLLRKEEAFSSMV